MHETTTSAPGPLSPGAAAGRGMDLEPSRRPGTPRMHAPRPLPNTIYPPERQLSRAKVFQHGRPHKTFPPVFGTAVPPRWLSGLIRSRAYRWPDHHMRHWTLLLFADRVDLWEHRARRLLAVAAPAAAAVGIALALRGAARAR
jgi:hypothetical protein